MLENLPDEKLVRCLEKERGQGRNDYPVRAMWNGLLAGLVYQHPSTASLIRELKRNVQLRYIYGFTGLEKVPNAHNYIRFLTQIQRHQEELDTIFQALVKELSRMLSGFGTRLAMDSKYVSSLAKRKSQRKNADGRSEQDADLGMKTYHGVHEDGTPWEKVVKCFGFKLHLLVDAKYELPVAFHVTKASASDCVEGHKLMDKLLSADNRIFNAVDRSNYKFKREYCHRTSVERVNSRLDNRLGFERHTIRGMKKMMFSLSLALILLLTMALGRVRQKQDKMMRSLVKTA